MKKKYWIFVLLFAILLTSGFSCKAPDRDVEIKMKPFTLNYWSVWDGPEAFDEIITSYKELHPYITINYRKLRYSEFESELINALAEDRGPDIFSIHNTWIRKYQNKLQPMPERISMVYPVVKGTLKKEIVPEIRTKPSITLKEIENNFVDVVYDDVVVFTKGDENVQAGNRVYGLPLSIDTLSMFYNRDLFNIAGIAQAPEFWNREFQQDVKKLTKQDGRGEIIQSGAALGGSGNITRYSDILSVLMMQNGAEMESESGQILFDQIPSNIEDRSYKPGLEALRFYTDFSNPAKEVYSWNNKQENSLDLFIKGKLGMLFGYSYFLPDIKARAPKLNLGIAKLPQIEGSSEKVNFANYWVETVSSKSQHKDEAWDFIQFMASEEQAKKYLEKTGKVTALRSLVNSQTNDQSIGVFAEQVLTAKSWYKGEDPAAMEKIIGEMIDMVVSGQDKIQNALTLGASKVQQTVVTRKSNE